MDVNITYCAEFLCEKYSQALEKYLETNCASSFGHLVDEIYASPSYETYSLATLPTIILISMIMFVVSFVTGFYLSKI